MEPPAGLAHQKSRIRPKPRLIGPGDCQARGHGDRGFESIAAQGQHVAPRRRGGWVWGASSGKGEALCLGHLRVICVRAGDDIVGSHRNRQ